jgi:hypothetical protein
MITISRGLSHSLKVLSYIKKDNTLKKINIYVGTFTNCRESGLTFIVSKKDNSDYFTFCVYEHRNSDNIIINGRKGYLTMNGSLPYSGGSKYEYLDSFQYNEDKKVAKRLSNLIKEWVLGNKIL